MRLLFGKKKKDPYAELEKSLGYTFRKRALLELALTHRSYRHDMKGTVPDNQRMEFLGDAVLGLLLTDIIYEEYGQAQEGVLTVLRSKIVSETGLAQTARKIKLGQYVRLGRSEMANCGQERNALLADTFEAVFGALYLDGGIAKTAKVFKHLFKDRMTSLSKDVWEENPKGRLQQLTQHKYHVAPIYTVVEEIGPSHSRRFKVEVVAGGHSAIGEGNNKQDAQVAAARELIQKLEEVEGEKVER